MSRESPQAVFAEAQDAIARREWEQFFSCLDRSDLRRIAENSLNALMGAPVMPASELAAICEQCGCPEGLLETLGELSNAMAASGRKLYAQIATGAPTAGHDSVRHQELVKEYRSTLAKGLKATADLPRLTACLEQQMRARHGGGSVAGDLFLGEKLHDVVIEGKSAWATRRHGSFAESVGFVLQKGGWSIRIMARRPVA